MQLRLEDPAVHFVLFSFLLFPWQSLQAQPVAITSPAQLPQATAGNYYMLQLTATGGQPPYLWSEAFTPPGITLSSKGVLSGTPAKPGDFAFTTKVTDSAGNDGITLLKLTVAAVPLTIATPVPIAAGSVGVPYSQAFTATGGLEPIRWTVSVGSALPNGFSLSTDGVLSGTPSVASAYPISVVATDAKGTTASASYQLTIAQPGGLVISAGSLAFTAISFGSNPPPQNITLLSPRASGSAGGPLSFQAITDQAWLTLAPGTGTTPSNIQVNVFPRLAPGNYSANIIITSANTPVMYLPVSLKVLPSPVSVSVAPAEIHLYGTRSATAPLTASLQLSNSGSGPVDYTTNVSGIPAATLSQSSGTVQPNAAAQLTISVDPRSLSNGYYRGRIEVSWGGGSSSALATLQVSTKPELFFSNSGGTADAIEGVGLIGPGTRSYSLFSTDATPIHYSVKVIGSAQWLTLGSTGSGTVTNASPATISYSIDPKSLTNNAYYARIRVTSPDILNSPQDYLVVLKVKPSDVPAPSLFPAGLAFVATGTSAPAVQTFAVYTNTGASSVLQLGVNTLGGGSWLSAKSSAATVSTTSPATVQVTVNPAGLPRGIYRGDIDVYVGGSTIRSESVVLVVAPSGSETSPASATTPAAGCTPTSLASVQTALEGNFFLFAGFPGAVNAKVLDDCGNPIGNATVVANFSNGDAPLKLRPSDPATGGYTQTWVPNHAVTGLVTTVTATAVGLTSSTQQIGGSAGSNSVPMLRGDGPLHIFYPRAGGPLAPGTLLQIYGSGLGNTSATAVDIGGILAPLLYAGDAQINAQVPFELVPGEYQIVAIVNNAITDSRMLTVDPVTPGVAGFADGSTIAQHAADFSLVTSSAPVKPNEFVILYLAGLGPTAPPVGTGEKSPLPPATITPLPGVTLDGKTAQVAFAGLSPGLIGLYQINFVVPPDAITGNLELQVVQNGVIANTSFLPVAR